MNLRISRRHSAIMAALIAASGTVAATPSMWAAAAGQPCAVPTTTTKTVTNTNDSGAGSLRAAIFKVNNPALGFDTIEFDINGKGAHIISPSSPLPALTSPVVIDGYSQPGSAPATDVDPATLNIEISMPSGVLGPGL